MILLDGVRLLVDNSSNLGRSVVGVSVDIGSSLAGVVVDGLSGLGSMVTDVSGLLVDHRT